MRPFRLILLLSVLPVAAPCAAHPRAQVTLTRHDYGERLPGLLPPVVFPISNRGDAPLVLRPRPCCDIIVTGAEKPVPPGATRRLVVRAAHLREGMYRKTVRVLTNDPSASELQFQLTATGRSPIQLLPGDQLSFPLNAEIQQGQRVELRSNDEPDLKISSITCSASYVQCQEVPHLLKEGQEPGRHHDVQVNLTPEAPKTPFEALVLIRTNCKRRPEVKLHVYGVSGEAVTAQPPNIYYEPIDKSEPNAYRLLMLTRAKGPFKVLEVTPADPRMKVTIRMDPSGTYGELLATFWPGRERGPFSGTITVRTDDPERPELVIPYSGDAH